ncbi:glycine cleavage system protein H [Hutsoniella sourekii]
MMEDNDLLIDPVDGQQVLRMSPQLQEELGDISYIEFLVEPGDKIVNGQSIISFEAEKALLEVASPLAGDVLEIHEAVIDQVELLQSKAKEDNWLISVGKAQSE